MKRSSLRPDIYLQNASGEPQKHIGASKADLRGSTEAIADLLLPRRLASDIAANSTVEKVVPYYNKISGPLSWSILRKLQNLAGRTKDSSFASHCSRPGKRGLLDYNPKIHHTIATTRSHVSRTFGHYWQQAKRK